MDAIEPFSNLNFDYFKVFLFGLVLKLPIIQTPANYEGAQLAQAVVDIRVAGAT